MCITFAYGFLCCNLAFETLSLLNLVHIEMKFLTNFESVPKII